MPLRQNLKPTLPDTLRKLRQDTVAGNTVAHGVKTVLPGEGLQLVSTTGSEIFWDWETANTWDTRITEGREVIEQTRAELDAAEQSIAAGTERITENRRILDSLAPEVTGARQTAEQAAKDLAAVDTRLTTTANGLATLQGSVGDVATAAAAAQAIAQDALLVGFDRNIVPSNGDGSSNVGWAGFGWEASGSAANNGNPGSYWVQGQKTLTTSKFGAVPGEYTWTASAKSSIAGSRWYLQLRAYNAAGALIGYNPYLVSNQTVPEAAWLTSSGTLTLPPETASLDLVVYGNHPNGTRDATAYQWFTGVSLRRMVPGALVVNGTITGDKVNAQSVAGAVGQFVEVKAKNVEVTEDFAARVVRSMNAEHRQLVVTEDALLAQATVLGTLTADQINSRGLIRGHDAIIDGTVDIEQLNITGEMAGTIARFMDVQARRAIFTEGLTAAESTLLGTTVAEAVNADTVASRIMTGGLLQTTSAANRGVKLDNAGVRAWDNSGRQTVQINGTSNYITGSFSTAPSGQRVSISNSGSVAAIDLYASRSTADHVGIWYDSPDTNALNSVGRMLAISGSSYNANSPGMLMYPMRGTFGFQGRWQQDTDATKFVELTNSVGLKAGEWAQITVTYEKAFPTNNSLRLPIVSIERLYGADMIVNVVSETASNITLLVVNKSASGSSGPIKVRAAVFNLNA